MTMGFGFDLRFLPFKFLDDISEKGPCPKRFRASAFWRGAQKLLEGSSSIVGAIILLYFLASGLNTEKSPSVSKRGKT